MNYSFEYWLNNGETSLWQYMQKFKVLYNSMSKKVYHSQKWKYSFHVI